MLARRRCCRSSPPRCRRRSSRSCCRRCRSCRGCWRCRSRSRPPRWPLQSAKPALQLATVQAPAAQPARAVGHEALVVARRRSWRVGRGVDLAAVAGLVVAVGEARVAGADGAGAAGAGRRGVGAACRRAPQVPQLLVSTPVCVSQPLATLAVAVGEARRRRCRRRTCRWRSRPCRWRSCRSVPQPPQLLGSVAVLTSQPLAGAACRSRRSPALHCATRARCRPRRLGVALGVTQAWPHARRSWRRRRRCGSRSRSVGLLSQSA